jgi:hypothetical protein
MANLISADETSRISSAPPLFGTRLQPRSVGAALLLHRGVEASARRDALLCACPWLARAATTALLGKGCGTKFLALSFRCGQVKSGLRLSVPTKGVKDALIPAACGWENRCGVLLPSAPEVGKSKGIGDSTARRCKLPQIERDERERTRHPGALVANGLCDVGPLEAVTQKAARSPGPGVQCGEGFIIHKHTVTCPCPCVWVN